jgi:hypothetical protein
MFQVEKQRGRDLLTYGYSSQGAFAIIKNANAKFTLIFLVDQISQYYT